MVEDTFPQPLFTKKYQYFESLGAILFFEQDRQGTCWESVVNQLVSATIEKAGELLLKNPNGSIISYLGWTNREYAVDVIFEMMKKHPIEANKNEFSHIAVAFGRDRPYKNHQKQIEKRLKEFLKSDNERLINLAKTLLKGIK